ncbi:hypothetical protein CLOM_g12777 [Closterium sp. NIES-68]|nr:hypothetical protein CLOM_g12777 [Closterium sp. NIES-68]
MLCNDAWWEGFLLEDVVRVGKRAEVPVEFPDEATSESVAIGLLRFGQEWDERTGEWRPRKVEGFVARNAGENGSAGCETGIARLSLRGAGRMAGRETEQRAASARASRQR